MSRHGMTLVELMIGAALLIGGGGTLLIGMQYAMIHSDYVDDYQVAMNAVQSRLEEVASTSFDTLTTSTAYTNARSSAGQCMGLGEDRDCDGILDAGEDLNGNGQLDEPLPGGRLNVQIRAIAPATFSNTTLLDLHVAACWSSRGRAIGEDRNCNGLLDAGEDANGNAWTDSPAMVSTRIAVRS